jgi:dynein heavy chain, axonemal
MCVNLQLAEGKIDAKDYDFFLRGGSGTSDQGAVKEPKPQVDWIKQTTWD